MDNIWIAVGIFAIGLGSIIIAVVGTVGMAFARNMKERRKPPAFRIEKEEVEIEETHKTDSP